MRVVFTIVAAWMICSRVAAQCSVQSFVPAPEHIEHLALDGEWAAFGDVPANDWEGAVHIYRLVGGVWQFHSQLVSPFPQGMEILGSSIAMQDDGWLVIGAPGSSAPLLQQGRVYIFRWNEATGVWEHEASLVASDGAAFDIFGWDVDIDGDRIIVAARDAVLDGQSLRGAVYIFRKNGDEWIEEAKLIDPVGEAGDLFGMSVALEGNVALIGAHANEDAGGGAGAAFVFEFDGEDWNLLQQLAPDPQSSGQTSAWFGYAVDISAGRLLIGAPEEESDNGAAYVFDRAGNHYVRIARLAAANPVGPFPHLGGDVSFAMNGTTVLGGAYFDDELAYRAGAVHVFRLQSEGWIETDKIFPPTAETGQRFGRHLAVSGTSAFVKADETAHYLIGIDGIDCNGNGQVDACDIHFGVSLDDNDNGIPDDCEAMGDLNGDGKINHLDLIQLVMCWGTCPPGSCAEDLNGDGAVNVLDLLILLTNWG